MDEALLRTLTPTVIGILVRRGADFAAAEDAVQDALVEAVRVWPDDPPRDPKGWLVRDTPGRASAATPQTNPERTVPGCAVSDALPHAQSSAATAVAFPERKKVRTGAAHGPQRSRRWAACLPTRERRPCPGGP